MHREHYTPGYSANASAFMVRRRAETHAAFLLPHLRPGQALLDCGCGPGTITLDLAQHVAPGLVTGIDRSDDQIARARDAATALGRANVDFRTANVYDLPFPAASFDVVFSHALLEHLAEPVRALAAMRRVLRPGGIIGVCSPDWGGFLVAPTSPALEAAISFYCQLQTANGGNVQAGRHLGQWLQAAGFTQVQMQARYECYADRSQIGEYLAHQIEAVEGQGRATANGEPVTDPPHQLAAALRQWQQAPAGLFAQAWVWAIGYAPNG
jgi:ubiquinone/menaquinone biosynthesis C-methylase UbiE